MHTRLAALLMLLTACGDKVEAEGPWLLDPQDLGADMATGTGFDLSDTSATWTAADQLIPGMFWDRPALDLVTAVFDTMLDDEGVTDPGTCPYSVAEGPSLVYITNCNSQDGYSFDGTVRYTDGDADGRDWRLWELDLEVGPRDEFSDFERVSLQGKIYTSDGSGEDALISALQANVRLSVEGYDEAVRGNATQEAIWTDWALSARYERHKADGGELLLMEGAADLGALGGLSFEGTDLLLPDSCPNEIDGELSVGDGTLTFDGSNGCDRCAALTIGGEDAGSACPG